MIKAELLNAHAAALAAVGDAEIRVAQALVAEATLLKREKPTLDAAPIPGCADYGGSGHTLQLALIELDESVPGGQLMRTALAAEAADRAWTQYKYWLRMKGYPL